MYICLIIAIAVVICFIYGCKTYGDTFVNFEEFNKLNSIKEVISTFTSQYMESEYKNGIKVSKFTGKPEEIRTLVRTIDNIIDGTYSKTNNKSE